MSEWKNVRRYAKQFVGGDDPWSGKAFATVAKGRCNGCGDEIHLSWGDSCGCSCGRSWRYKSVSDQFMMLQLQEDGDE